MATDTILVYSHVQQTPNPSAHDEPDVPPRFEHSDLSMKIELKICFVLLPVVKTAFISTSNIF